MLYIILRFGIFCLYLVGAILIWLLLLGSNDDESEIFNNHMYLIKALDQSHSSCCWCGKSDVDLNTDATHRLTKLCTTCYYDAKIHKKTSYQY